MPRTTLLLVFFLCGALWLAGCCCPSSPCPCCGAPAGCACPEPDGADAGNPHSGAPDAQADEVPPAPEDGDVPPVDVPMLDVSVPDVPALDAAAETVADGTSPPDDIEGDNAGAEDTADEVTPPPMDVEFPPVPEEDHADGRNSNVYLAAYDHPTSAEQEAFVSAIEGPAVAAAQAYGVPACAVGGMAIVESGYGFTRTGWHANNLFGLKHWDQGDPTGAGAGIETYQLRGQPDEAFDGSVTILQSFGSDRHIFDEEPRYDNRYLVFPGYDECVDYLVTDRFMGDVLLPFVLQYQERLAAGWSVEEAAFRFLFEIAAPPWPGFVYDPQGNDEYYLVTHVNEEGQTVYGGGGYCHQGGTIYSQGIGAAMDQWDLYSWDVW